MTRRAMRFSVSANILELDNVSRPSLSIDGRSVRSGGRSIDGKCALADKPLHQRKYERMYSALNERHHQVSVPEELFYVSQVALNKLNCRQLTNGSILSCNGISEGLPS